MPQLEIKAEAERDLDDILDYSVSQFGIEVAEGYISGFDDAFDRLIRHPQIGAASPELGDGVRTLSYRSHRILYQHCNDTVLIVRILHKVRDAGAILN